MSTEARFKFEGPGFKGYVWGNLRGNWNWYFAKDTADTGCTPIIFFDPDNSDPPTLMKLNVCPGVLIEELRKRLLYNAVAEKDQQSIQDSAVFNKLFVELYRRFGKVDDEQSRKLESYARYLECQMEHLQDRITELEKALENKKQTD
jgi:hypothetical protein